MEIQPSYFSGWNRLKNSSAGLVGIWSEERLQVGFLLFPLGAVLLIIGAYVRPWALAQLGLVCVVLLTLILTDGVRARRHAAIALDPSLPLGQRIQAKIEAESSYFHDWRARLRWVGQEK